MCLALTLNDVGDHESSAGVVTDETTTGQVAFNLQGEQIPGERKTERDRFRDKWKRVSERERGKKGRQKARGYWANAHSINSTAYNVRSNPIIIKVLPCIRHTLLILHIY